MSTFKHLAVAVWLAGQWAHYRMVTDYPVRDGFTARRLWLGYAFRDTGQG